MGDLGHKPVRILAVDDEQTILDLYRSVLCPARRSDALASGMNALADKLFGAKTRNSVPVCDVTFCRQADEAVEVVRRAMGEGNPFAVAFLDVRMPPGPDGVWAAEQLRALDPDVNILMVTAYSDIEPNEIAARVPPADKLLYVQKPFHVQEILQFVSALGAKWQAERFVRECQADLSAQVEKRTAELADANVRLEREIGEHKRVQADLERMISVLRATFESTAEGILVVDREGVAISYNQRFLEMWEIPESGAARLKGRLMDEMLARVKDPESFRARQAAALERPENEGFDFLETRDGKTFERCSKPQRIGGAVVGRVWSLRDITRRRHAEEALRHSEEQLRQAQKMEALGQLAGGIAHDFYNHLTAIMGYADLLLRDASGNPALRHKVEEICKAGERAATLTRQLLAFGRRQVLQTKMVDLNAVLIDMEPMLRRLIGENIELVTNLDPELGRVKADPGQIEQVLMNLVVNARDAMPHAGKMTIETRNVEAGDAPEGAVHLKRCVAISVADTGTGMDAQTQARIFEPFFTTKEVGRGTGLGLATVYGIVQQSGGHVTVSSKPGCGAVFHVFLPRAARVSEEASAPVLPDSVPLEGTETLLLAEDEDGVRELISGSLAAYGYTVLPARDGAEALEIGKTHRGPIHLLLTDFVMPQMNGADLAAQLSATLPETRVLYISGYTNDALVQRQANVSHTNFLPKPFSMEDLARAIRAVLSKETATDNKKDLSMSAQTG